MEKLEAFARAYRNSTIGTELDDNAWDSCKGHWIQDAKKFLRKLHELKVTGSDFQLLIDVCREK